MHKPLKITCRNIEHLPGIDSLVQESEHELEHFCSQINACDVLIEASPHGRKDAKRVRVRIKLGVPGERLNVVIDEPCAQPSGEKACIAIRHAFENMQRLLEEYLVRARLSPGDRLAPRQGRVSELLLDMNYGKIATSDGSEVYFHRNSVLENKFDSLRIGTPVKFIDQPGLLGPQAITVKVIRRRDDKPPERVDHH